MIKIMDEGKEIEIYESRLEFWREGKNYAKKCIDAATEEFPLLKLTYPLIIPTKTLMDLIVYPLAISFVEYSQKYGGYIKK